MYIIHVNTYKVPYCAHISLTQPLKLFLFGPLLPLAIPHIFAKLPPSCDVKSVGPDRSVVPFRVRGQFAIVAE